MAIYHPGMFAFDGEQGCEETGICDSSQAYPLGPGLAFDDWWFHGPNSTSRLPNPSDAVELPAGKEVTLEIACSKRYSSYGNQTSTPGSRYDACPRNFGLYHADPIRPIEGVKLEYISQCALAISDTTDWRNVKFDNTVVFSINGDCVSQKLTTWSVPKTIPSCTGKYCICSWYWIATTGLQNFYMQGFYCKVTGGSKEHKFTIPKPPKFCGVHGTLANSTSTQDADSSQCIGGAKQPLFVYNTPSNVNANWTNDSRPGYRPNWSFKYGAQEDAFTPIDGGDDGSGVNKRVLAIALVIACLALVIIICAFGWWRKRKHKRRHHDSPREYTDAEA